MTDTNIELHKVECYVVVHKATGAKTELLKAKSKWNGMLELVPVATGGGMLIIDAPSINSISAAFGDLPNLFGGDPKPIAGVLIKGSPELLTSLFERVEGGAK